MLASRALALHENGTPPDSPHIDGQLSASIVRLQCVCETKCRFTMAVSVGAGKQHGLAGWLFDAIWALSSISRAV